MKECRSIEREQLLQLMKEYELIYDVVRLVEPENTAVITYEEGTLKKTQLEPCFAVWDKTERCENCVSRRACTEKKRMTKFEFSGDDVYSVVAMPFLVSDGECQTMVSLELVNHITQDLVIQTRGHGKAVDQVTFFSDKLYQDSLTGAYNRRYYDEKRYIYEMSRMLPRSMGFVVIDINKFKHVNDTYGHSGGDLLLLSVAETLKRSVRNTDKVIRVGGDEFLIVLRDCSRIFVEKKIRRLKKAVSEIALPRLGEFRPSIAAGMSYVQDFTGTEEQINALFAEADKRMYENKSMPSGEKKKMLLVDDMEINRAALHAFFDNDFIIFEAEDGIEALKILARNTIEIVITDIFMPRMDGFELIRRIREQRELEKLVVFAITDRGEQLELQALEAGADDFINKPFNPELLNHRIKGVLSQNTVNNRISQYQLSFNQNQIPFATVRVKNDAIVYEYVNDAFAQLMDTSPEQFVSGRRTLRFEGFPELVREVSRTHQRKQLHVHDEINGNHYDIVAYAQENGFCSFIMLKNDAPGLMKE